MLTNWRYEVPQWVVILAMFTVAVCVWPSAPERIPVHWNLQGEVDRYGGRFEGLLLLPLMGLGAYLLMLGLPYLDRKRANDELFRGPWIVMRLTILALLFVIHTCIILMVFGYPINMNFIVPLAIGVMLLILGSQLGKVRPNRFMGVRTTWTLTSRASWDKTNRLGGRLFILIGLTMIGAGLNKSAWMFGLSIGLVVISAIWLIVYSYLIYRDDPDRLSTSSVSPAPGDDHK